MLNEWKEFQAYTKPVTYTAARKRDTTYMGRFTFDTMMDFEGLSRVLTVLEPVFCILLLLISTAYLVDGSFNPFLYFRF